MIDFFRHGRSSIGGAQSALLSQARGRLLLVVSVFLLGYLAIGLRLVDLTLLRTKPEAAPVAAASGKPLRAAIFDRNGDLLAASLSMASVYADATLIRDPKDTAKALAEILADQKQADLQKKLSSGKKFIWLARNITPRQEYAINALGNPGLGFKKQDRRIYPAGRLAAHIIGYTDVDGNGLAGIEKSYDKSLAAGEDALKLSIDMRLQHLLHRELSQAVKNFSAKAGVGLVTDVDTGEILALVSLPDFDPYRPGEASDAARFNRASLGVFEMGSTFKLFSTAAALDSGKIGFNSWYDAAEPIKYGRFTISDYHPEKRMLSVPEIFIYSSNIGTARMAQAVGTDVLKNFYEKMGFFSAAPIELPERGTPLYPKPWRDINTLTASFGHGIAVSPLHLMRAAGAIVNGGRMLKSTLLYQEHPPAAPADPVVKAETVKKILKLMELVVADGTGSKAYVEGYNVGGKTGTAEKPGRGGYNQSAVLSSFLGVFPVEHPRYAVLAILDEPQATKETHGFATGGWTAAPVVSRVIAQMAPLYQIPPAFDTSRDIVHEMAPYLNDDKKGKQFASAGTDR